ncbi:MAG: hypothetical protein HY077_06600 [Elusimicrobia bacterium]|nr:hypothetical protein [Elusimicrobiota bacterium]
MAYASRRFLWAALAALVLAGGAKPVAASDKTNGTPVPEKPGRGVVPVSPPQLPVTPPDAGIPQISGPGVGAKLPESPEPLPPSAVAPAGTEASGRTSAPSPEPRGAPGNEAELNQALSAGKDADGAAISAASGKPFGENARGATRAGGTPAPSTVEKLAASWRGLVESVLPGHAAKAPLGAQGGKMESGYILPKQLGKEQVKYLSLLLPDGAYLKQESPGTLLLNFFGHQSHKMLFTFEIKLDQKPDFSGTSLPNLISDLAGTAAARYRSLANSGMPMPEKIAAVVDATERAVSGRHLRSRDYALTVRKIHTTKPHDWY